MKKAARESGLRRGEERRFAAERRFPYFLGRKQVPL
jgi:hypothetical protein